MTSHSVCAVQWWSRSFAAVFFIILVFSATISASCQALDNSSISGRVTDQNGAIVPGAIVETVLMKTGVSRHTTADETGRYRVIQLEPGAYRLTVTATGFAIFTKSEITVIAGQNVQLDV